MAIKFLNTVQVDTDVLYVNTANDRVGIGTTSPAVTLHVDGFARLNGGLQMNATNAQIYQILDSDLRFGTNNTERMRIDSTGNVGIGTTSPSTKLDVQGAVTIKGTGTGTSGSLAIQDDYSGANHLANIGWIRSSGGVYLSYGLKQENSTEWKSTYANFSGERTYAKLDNNEFSMAYAPSQNTAVGTAVTGLTERFKFYLNTGVLQLNSYSAGILSTSSNGTVGIASSGDLPGGPYLPLSAGSSYPLTSDLYIEGADKALRINNGAQPVVYLGDGGANTDGQLILYNSSGSANIVLNGDNQNHYITNGNVGIGTTSPGAKLHVSGGNLLFDAQYGVRFVDGNTRIYTNSDSPEDLIIEADQDLLLNPDGNVGIGTTSPSTKLDVRSVPSGGSGTILNIGLDAINPVRAKIHTESFNGAFSLYDSGSNEDVKITTSGNSYFNGGNVGIGTTSPSASLQIGSAVATSSEKLDVRGNSSANYVASFEQDHATGYGVLIDTDGTLVSEPALRVKNTASDLFYIGSNGNVGIGTTAPEAKLDIRPDNNNAKVLRVGNYSVSTYSYNTQADATIDLTCGSYYQAEVIITANQTNGGDYNNIYIRGIWSNNHTTHHWDEIESIGFLTGSSIGITVGQNTVSNSGKLSIDFNYTNQSFSILNIKVTDFYGSHSYSIS